MVEIIKTYKQSLPAARLIGKRYTDLDRGPLGAFGNLWVDWYTKKYYAPLMSLGPIPENEKAHVGFMRWRDGLEYWTGILLPADTPVPDGYQYADIPKGNIGICWLQGYANKGELYGEYTHNLCKAKLMEEGMQIADQSWFFERFVHSRFAIPDEQGRVILDYCIYIKTE